MTTLPLDECRRILGPVAEGLDDRAVERLVGGLSQIADLAIEHAEAVARAEGSCRTAAVAAERRTA